MKAQTSVEMIVVLSVLFLVLIVIFATSSQTIFGYNTIQEERQSIIALDSLATAANRIYIQGDTAFETIRIRFPSNVESLEFDSNLIILNSYGNNNQILKTIRAVPFLIEGEIDIVSAVQLITLTSNGTHVLVSSN